MRHKCDCGYRTFNRRRLKRHQRNCEVFNSGWETEQRDSERPEAQEKSFNELRHEAKEREIEGYGKMNKEQLMAALKE